MDKFWLIDQGVQARVHLVHQDQARSFLQMRLEDSKRCVGARASTSKHLTLLALKAQQRVEGPVLEARSRLHGRVRLLRLHRPARVDAQEGLAEMLGEAKLKRSLARVALKHPLRLEALVKKTKESDRLKESERRRLTPAARLREEIKEAFDVYDQDSSGEIDRLEFRALIGGGTLFDMPLKLVEDTFKMMDKDRSGAVDFDEFLAWFSYETAKNPPAMPFTVASRIPARFRAVRELLQQVEAEQTGST